MVIDRLRRSLRGLGVNNTLSLKEAESHAHQAKHDDELAVRRGAQCTFPVKYLGSIEVREARGVDVCERALEQLRRRASTGNTAGTTHSLLDAAAANHLSTDGAPLNKVAALAGVHGVGASRVSGVLHITSDGLRFVAEDERQLLVDQTLDRVSFCAPDRRHPRAFAYICRDATTRRWICHGFHAIAGSSAANNANLGERVAHAIGCAFVVCHERKQKLESLVHTQQQQSASTVITPICVPNCLNANSYSNQQQSISQSLSTTDHSIGTTTTPAPLYAPQQMQITTQHLSTNHLVFTRPPIAERWVDPQTCLRRIDAGPRPTVCPTPNPYAIERPRATIVSNRPRRSMDSVPDGRMLAAAICKSRCAAA